MSDTPSLAEDVLARHVAQEYGAPGGEKCDRCETVWPCDAYRLALIIRNVEAWAESVEFTKNPRRAILAITKEETT